MEINRTIEHTNLKPTLTNRAIDTLVKEAADYNFLGICVPPFWVKRASREIAGKNIVLVTVVGFPLGYQMTETKLKEIEMALENGADEIDMVMNISAFKTNMPWTKIELAKCAKLAHDSGKMLKVIIETAYLSDSEIIDACKMASDSGADFLKTSTGFAGSGATVEHIRLMRSVLPANVGVKASGGISTLAMVRDLIEAGANRIGASAGVKIMEELR